MKKTKSKKSRDTVPLREVTVAETLIETQIRKEENELLYKKDAHRDHTSR